MTRSSRYSSQKPEDYQLEDIKNYFEHMDFDGLCIFHDEFNENELADLACIALNKLSPWYIRHSVDAQFYAHDDQYAEMKRKATLAIDYAIAKVSRDSS